jgi:hypothetical protein
MRIQFDINDQEWDRASRYISNPKIRHEIAHIAFEEWITRREGRDKRIQFERLYSDAKLMAPVIAEAIKTGMVKLP